MSVEKPVTEMTSEELDQVIQSDNQPEADPTPAQPEAPAPQGEPAKPDEVGEMKQVIERMSKQLADSQSMIGRQANEIGELRKKLTPKPEPVTPDEVLTNPVGATKKLVAEEIAEREQRKQEEYNAMIQARTQAAQFLAQAVPDIMELLPTMAEIAEQEDGVPKEFVERFKADPLSEAPIITVQLAKRARLKRELLELKTKTGELEQKPGELIDKINQAAKTRPAVTGSHGHAGKSTGTTGLTRDQIRKLSDKELDELIKAG